MTIKRRRTDMPREERDIDFLAIWIFIVGVTVGAAVLGVVI